jgi:hypothetical protein
MGDTADNHASPHTTSQDSDDRRAVLDVLDPEQLVTAKAAGYGRRQLSLRAQAVMWALRLYLVLMLVVVIDRIVHAMHAG